jgi:hypothetical protein
MPASLPASMVNQILPDLGIPNRFGLNSSRSRTTRHDAPAFLGGDHAFRKCVAELLKHRGEERSQEQSEYRQQQ